MRRAESRRTGVAVIFCSHRLFETFTGLRFPSSTLELGAASPRVRHGGGVGPADLDAPAKLLMKSIPDAVVIRKPRSLECTSVPDRDGSARVIAVCFSPDRVGNECGVSFH